MAEPVVQEEALTAQAYFERGFQATEPAEKVRLYSQAIRINPNFLSADLLDLGAQKGGAGQDRRPDRRAYEGGHDPQRIRASDRGLGSHGGARRRRRIVHHCSVAEGDERANSLMSFLSPFFQAISGAVRAGQGASDGNENPAKTPPAGCHERRHRR